MPGIDIATAERKRIEDFIILVKQEFARLTPEGKKVFVIAFGRTLGSDFRAIHEEMARK